MTSNDFATGGPIEGPGDGSDSIPVVLSRGCVPADMTRFYGTEMLEAVNRVRPLRREAGSEATPRIDLVQWLTEQIDQDEAWARAANRPYEYADEGATAPVDGVHWRWVHGDHWQTATLDPAMDEFVAEPGYSCWLATVEEWPSRGRSMPRVYANSIVEMDVSAAGHIVRHDPSRVLRQVAAYRRTLARHQPVPLKVWSKDPNMMGIQVVVVKCVNCVEDLQHRRYRDWPCPELLDLSSVWADRPGFDPSWTVET